MGLKLGKGQFECRVKYGHEMKILYKYRVTHILLVIWDLEFDGVVHFQTRHQEKLMSDQIWPISKNCVLEGDVISFIFFLALFSRKEIW